MQHSMILSLYMCRPNRSTTESKTREFRDSDVNKGCIFLIAHARKSHITISGLKSDDIIVFTAPIFNNTLLFLQFGRKQCIMFIAYAQNGHISTSGLKSDVTSCSSTPISCKMLECRRFAYI